MPKPETNITANSTLTINTTSADSYFNGYLRNGNYGSGSTGRLALVKERLVQADARRAERQRLYRRNDRQRRHAAIRRRHDQRQLPGNASVSAHPPLRLPDNATCFNVAGGTSVAYSGAISGTGSVTSLAPAR